MLIVDETGIILHETASSHKIFGYSSEVFLGSNITEYIFEEEKIKFAQILRNLATQPLEYTLKSSFRILDINGHRINVDITFIGMINDPIFDGIIINIKKPRTNNNLFSNQNHNFHIDYDAGFVNKNIFLNSFQEKIILALQNNQILMIMALNFKYYKSQTGKEIKTINDDLLSLTANKLQSIYRQNDTMCRITSNDYLLLFENINFQKDIDSIEKRVTEIFSYHLIRDNESVKVTLNLERSLLPYYPHPTKGKAKICKYALSEKMGKGFNFHEIFSKKSQNLLVFPYILKWEIEKAFDNQEFILHYQPIFNNLGKLCKIEALIRWQSPTHGLLEPNQFISFAEKTGQILDIDRYVVFNACQQIKSWNQENHLSIPVAVNISPYSIENGNIVKDISNALGTFGVSPISLEIEIIEIGLVKNNKASIKNLKILQAMGIRIAIDDFGTGSSSLSKLKDYPVDILKIDKSFITYLGESKKTLAIIEMIISLAQTLSLDVAAKGIESEKQFKILKRKGCSQYQGFFLGEPLNSENFRKIYDEECIYHLAFE